jgi:putative heme-binding domain-containing protein
MRQPVMHRTRSACVVWCAAVLLATDAGAQVETWADARLSVREGLELWLTADTVSLLKPIANEQWNPKPVDRWRDASGRQRDFLPPADNFRPQLVQLGDDWVVRFDGVDDYLRCIAPSGELGSVTVFLVVAPHENPGDFRGLFASNAPGARDYETGLTIDLGPFPTTKFDQLNIEGRGFGGANDLLIEGDQFGHLHTLETVIDRDAKNVRLVVDGKSQGTRDFQPAGLSFRELTLGARYYTNGPGSQEVRGPAAVDIAELLVYHRVLSEDETNRVRDYLSTKYARLAEELPRHLPQSQRPGVPLVKAENPPAVQMLVPGYDVRELPIELTNVNNVRYRDDGVLITLGYNGDIHLLRDTNGDGLEESAEVFFQNEGQLRGPIGIALTPPGYARGRGVFVPSKGKVSLIVDTNGDDRADEEIVVASGWNEIVQNVDAVGMALDPEGNLYFGLGTADYSNAYLIDQQGNAAYDIASDRGTVQKVSADFSTRETVCTGIRFPIAFAFNAAGDLFCTEQEGATWLANGNPFDELLHVQPDRHYGFPPRHPQHNPGVLDEPSTFDYSPQHQSTCGMVFNTSVNGGPVFGPAWWHDQALICGESRGKIWRTQLAKSASGYVAASQLIACLQMLTVDSCVAPNGDLVIACHSGPPDWGTGPTGIGKLFRVRMTHADIPRPVATWAESPQEIRITFDGPLDPESLRNITEQVRIEYGKYVRAGDRFETLAPPYEVVQKQLREPRFALAVHGVSVTNDLRTLVLSTDPMSLDVGYAVTLPAAAQSKETPTPLKQHPQLDVDFTLHGVRAEWTPQDGTTIPAWSGWLPHLDLQVSRELLAESAAHQPLWEALQQPGTLTLQTQLRLNDILRPAIQPGSTIDYEWEPEVPELTVSSNLNFVVSSIAGSDAPSVATVDPLSNDPTYIHKWQPATSPEVDLSSVSLTLQLITGEVADPTLTCSVSTNEDPRARPLPLHRFLLPWVDPAAAEPSSGDTERVIAELAGGSWSRGRRVFRSETAGCYKCHALHGDTARIGPDLRNLVHRDYHSVLRDLRQPSFAINPDYIGHVVAFTDGTQLVGVLRTEAGELWLGDDKGRSTRINRDDVELMLPAKVSTMPQGLLDKLSEDDVRDLLTYLLTPAPHMPLDSPLPAPPVRTQAEVAAALAGAPEAPTEYRPLRVVLVAGDKDHGPGEHDYPAWQRAWLELLAADPTLTVETAWDFPSDAQLATADLVLFFQRGKFDGDRPARLDAYLARGGGAVYIHWAVNGDDRAEEFAKRIGLASHAGGIKFRHGPLALDIYNTDHPIVRNFDRLELYDESYWEMFGDLNDSTLLATSVEEGEATPQMWVRDHQPGRVFVCIPGHYSWTFDDPLFRILLLRGCAWTCGEPVDRFNDLVPLGSRMAR